MSETVPQEENVGMYQMVTSALFVLETDQYILITLDVDRIHQWYKDRIGAYLTIAAWTTDIEPVLLYRIKEIKAYVAKKKKMTAIQIIHTHVMNWLTLKLHKALDPHCDRFQITEAGVVIDI